MTKWKKLSHTIYQCKYHIAWCPKYRYRILKVVVVEFVEQTLRMLCEWRNIEILEMNVINLDFLIYISRNSKIRKFTE